MPQRSVCIKCNRSCNQYTYIISPFAKYVNCFFEGREAAKPRHFAEQNAGEPQQRLSRAVGARRFGGAGEGRAERKPRRPPTKGGAFCEAKCGGPSGGGRIAERPSRLSQSSSLPHPAQRRSRHDSADSFSCHTSAKSAKHGARRKRRWVRLSPPLSAAFAFANAHASPRGFLNPLPSRTPHNAAAVTIVQIHFLAALRLNRRSTAHAASGGGCGLRRPSPPRLLPQTRVRYFTHNPHNI